MHFASDLIALTLKFPAPAPIGQQGAAMVNGMSAVCSMPVPRGDDLPTNFLAVVSACTASGGPRLAEIRFANG
jgi:hypothetical protein